MTANTVLIIDSDTTTAEALQDLFASHDLPTEVATDGQVGLQKAQEIQPRLIVLAIELPLISGYSVCKKIKRDNGLSDIPLFLISSTATEDTFAQHRKLKTRADEYFLKPLSYDDLWAEAEKHLFPDQAAEIDMPELEDEDDEDVIALGDNSSLPEASYLHEEDDESGDEDISPHHADTAVARQAIIPSSPPSQAPVEVAILQRQLESREADLQAIREEHNKTLSELMELRSNYTSAQNQILEVKQDLHRRDTDLNESKRRITDLEIADEQLRTSLSQANVRAQELGAQLEALHLEQQSTLEQLNEDQDQLEDRYTEQLGELQQLKRQTSTLEAQLAEQAEAKGALEAQITEKDEQFKALEESLAELKETHEVHVEAHDELQIKFGALKSENEAALSILGEAEEQLDRLQKEGDGYKAQLEEKAAELAALQKDFEAVSEARGEIQSQVQSLQEERDTIGEARDALTVEREALRMEIDALQEKLQSASGSQESLVEELSNAQDKVAALEVELQTTQQSMSTATQESEDLRGALEDLRSVSNQRQTELESVNATMSENLKTTMADLEATAQYASELEIKLQSAGELVQKLAGLMAASQQALSDARRVTALAPLSAAPESPMDSGLYPPNAVEASLDREDDDSIDIDIDAYDQPESAAAAPPLPPLTRPRDAADTADTEQLASELMDELTGSMAEEGLDDGQDPPTHDISHESLEDLQLASRESTALHLMPNDVSHTEMFSSGNSDVQEISDISIIDIEDDPLISGDDDMLDDAVVVDDDLLVGENIEVGEIVMIDESEESEGQENPT